MNTLKTTPKYFFMWFGAIITLYLSVGSFSTLLFALINELFAGSGISGYSMYTSGMTIAVACLIIVFPLYIILMRIVNQMLRKNSELKNLWIRRWAVYLTIFLAGLGITIDLVVLVYTFLSGEELTAAFLLKVLAILIIFGAVFSYYLLDIRGYWENNEKMSKLFSAFVSIIVIASIICGFLIMGTPATQRKIRDDKTRIRDLGSIQLKIANYYNSKEEIPQELASLNDALADHYIKHDPATGESYGYSKIDDTTFKICATFELDSPVVDTEKADMSDWRVREIQKETEQWNHSAERTCFERKVDEDIYGIKPMRLVD